MIVKQAEYPDIVCKGCKHKYNRRDDAKAEFDSRLIGDDRNDVWENIR